MVDDYSNPPRENGNALSGDFRGGDFSQGFDEIDKIVRRRGLEEPVRKSHPSSFPQEGPGRSETDDFGPPGMIRKAA